MIMVPRNKGKQPDSPLMMPSYGVFGGEGHNRGVKGGFSYRGGEV